MPERFSALRARMSPERREANERATGEELRALEDAKKARCICCGLLPEHHYEHVHFNGSIQDSLDQERRLYFNALVSLTKQQVGEVGDFLLSLRPTRSHGPASWRLDVVRQVYDCLTHLDQKLPPTAWERILKACG
jgi:hypothetical protein